MPPHFQECLYLMFCKNGVKTFAYPSYLELFDSIPKDGFLSYGILIFQFEIQHFISNFPKCFFSTLPNYPLHTEAFGY